jgi:hypothetical protein
MIHCPESAPGSTRTCHELAAGLAHTACEFPPSPKTGDGENRAASLDVRASGPKLESGGVWIQALTYSATRSSPYGGEHTPVHAVPVSVQGCTNKSAPARGAAFHLSGIRQA